MTCFVSDGSGREPGSPVDEGLCGELELGVDGERPVVLEESCAVPCPGEQTAGPPRAPRDQTLSGLWDTLSSSCFSMLFSFRFIKCYI